MNALNYPSTILIVRERRREGATWYMVQPVVSVAEIKSASEARRNFSPVGFSANLWERSGEGGGERKGGGENLEQRVGLMRKAR